MTDLLLAIAHHLLIFTIAAMIAMELALLRPGLDVKRVATIDAIYGAAAGLLVIVGFSRVFFGLKGSAFYLENPVFWAKIAAFAVVGLLSISPTLRLLAWRRRTAGDPSFAPSTDDVRAARRFLLAEAHVFILIPIFAALMARGYGLG